MSASAPGTARPASRSLPAPIVMLAVAMAAGLASAALTLLDVRLPLGLRGILAVAAITTIPGIPVMVAARIGTPGVQLVLGVAISLSCWLIAAQAELKTGLWSPFAAQAVLTTVALAATLVALATRWDDR